MGNILIRRPLLAIGETAQVITWQDVFDSISAGTYASDFSLGDSVALSVGSEGTVNMQMVAFDTDILSDDTGYAHITFIAKEALKTNNQLGGSSARKWSTCNMRATFLRTTVWEKLPANVKEHIVEVKKYTRDYSGADTTLNTNAQTNDTIWIPSGREMGSSGGSYGETEGVTYSSFFTSAADRIKCKYNDLNTPVQYRLRSWGTSNSRSRCITNVGGFINNIVISTASGSSVVIGFCM